MPCNCIRFFSLRSFVYSPHFFCNYVRNCLNDVPYNSEPNRSATISLYLCASVCGMWFNLQFNGMLQCVQSAIGRLIHQELTWERLNLFMTSKWMTLHLNVPPNVAFRESVRLMLTWLRCDHYTQCNDDVTICDLSFHLTF